MKKLFSFLVIFLLSVSLNAYGDNYSGAEKKVSECPYLQKIHENTSSSECPYLNSKIQSSDEQKSECPYLNKKMESKSSSSECPYSGEKKSSDKKECPYSGKSGTDVKESTKRIKVKIS